MDQQTRMAKQMMDLQRATFDGMMNNISLFWDQTEKMLGTVLDQATVVPEEGRKAFREWIDGNKKGCEVFKKAVNDSFSRLEGCFGGGVGQ
jgi:hypothetical protein